jgi:hypothetical protein
MRASTRFHVAHNSAPDAEHQENGFELKRWGRARAGRVAAIHAASRSMTGQLPGAHVARNAATGSTFMARRAGK